LETLWDGGPVYSGGAAFPLTADSVLLADFAGVTARKTRVCDLGCGAGILSLLLAWGRENVTADAVDISQGAVNAAERNFAQNGLSDRVRASAGDIRTVDTLFEPGSYDLVISNPPYFALGSGKTSRDGAAARAESECTFRELCAAAKYLTRRGGSFVFVHRPERLAELFRELSECRLEPKRMRLVQHTAASAPSVALLECRLYGKPSLAVLPSLILKGADGGDSAELLRILHLG
jgi:tRNA1(Val) A37 N6-methylase TrmN6